MQIKKNLFFYFVTIIFFLEFFAPKGICAESRMINLDETSKCQFLLEKFCPDDYISFKKRLFIKSLKLLIPIISTLVTYKILNEIIIKPNHKQKAEKGGYELLLASMASVDKILNGTASYQDRAAFSELLKKFDHLIDQKKILQNALLYSLTVGSYFLTNSIIKKMTEKKSDLKIIEDFFKNWPTYKNLTPNCFHKKFESLYNIFIIQNKLGLSEKEATCFLTNLITEIIEYKFEIG